MLNEILFKYSSSNYVLIVEGLILLGGAANIVLRLKKMAQSKATRKLAEVGAKAFETHCGHVCQSLF
jgi:hypothetical protein